MSAKTHIAPAFAALVVFAFVCSLIGEAAATFSFSMCACQAAYYLGRLRQQEGEAE